MTHEPRFTEAQVQERITLALEHAAERIRLRRDELLDQHMRQHPLATFDTDPLLYATHAAFAEAEHIVRAGRTL